MILSRISSKGQVTLPRKVRQALQVKPGDRVLFVVADDTVILQLLAAGTASTLGGSLRQYAGARPSGLARGTVKKEAARAAAQES
jgi:AbrB family looped-hinge helix DNA binding protein